jgi:hypothetical protein
LFASVHDCAGLTLKMKLFAIIHAQKQHIGRTDRAGA